LKGEIGEPITCSGKLEKKPIPFSGRGGDTGGSGMGEVQKRRAYNSPIQDQGDGREKRKRKKVSRGDKVCTMKTPRGEKILGEKKSNGDG